MSSLVGFFTNKVGWQETLNNSENYRTAEYNTALFENFLFDKS